MRLDGLDGQGQLRQRNDALSTSRSRDQRTRPQSFERSRDKRTWAPDDHHDHRDANPLQPARPPRVWTKEELVKALRADMQRPYREPQTHLAKLREQAIAAEKEDLAAVEARAQRQRARRPHWSERRPGQLRRIRAELRAGNSRGLSVKARRMLVLIGRRPDVVVSRKWTTAKVSRVTINTDLLRSHFHRWAASVARNAVALAERVAADRAASARVRQDELLYESLEAAFDCDLDDQDLTEQRAEADRLAALQRLVDHASELREDARLEALELKELNDVPRGPWLALDATARPLLTVLRPRRTIQ